jgi:uncharacterized protein (TIGR02118 family)
MVVIYKTPRDVAAFEKHYWDVHIPLAKQLPGLRSYSVSRNPRAVRGEQPYLVGQLEWDDMAALQHAFGTDLGKQCSEDATTLAGLCGGVRSMIFEPALV